MFTLTIKELSQAKTSFDHLAALDSVKAAIKLRLAPIIRSVKQHLEDAQEARLSLFKTYGKPSETVPGNYELPPDVSIEIKRTLYEALESLNSEPIQIPGKKIPFEAVAEASYVQPGVGRVSLTAEDLQLLDWIIDLPAEEDAETPAVEKAAHATA